MGKSPKPLSFLIHPLLVEGQLLAGLAEQGHTVHYSADQDPGRQIWDYDIILSPNCWRAFDLKHLDLAIKSARAVKYPPGERKVKPVKKPARKPRKVKGNEDHEG